MKLAWGKTNAPESSRANPVPLRGQCRISVSARATRDDGGGRVLLHVDNGRMWAINQMGSRIWDGLAAGTAPEQIAKAIAREQRVPLEGVQRDVQTFLDELEARDLVMVSPRNT
ncbi:MAG: PqqD family peptide modification chaperone [Luteitalea sp.]|nr:PqqD family peptide modification chaperone [Luteitalea sp.]